MSKNQAIILAVAGFIVIFVLAVVFGGFGIKEGSQKVSLTVWGTEDEGSFRDVFAGYSDINKGVKIKYEKVDESGYEKKLVDALAAGTGPDIFMFHSDWLNQHKNKIVPAPTEIFPAAKLDILYPQIIASDFSDGGKVYALPLYLDTLSLIYNKDSLDRKGVALPPKTWDELETQVKKKRLIVSLGDKSSIIPRAKEILMSMMMQNGLKPTIGSVRLSTNEGQTALTYYTKFDSSKSAGSIDDFTAEKNDIIFDFQSASKLIHAKNPTLNFGYAPLPQFNADSPVVVADYYGLAVSNKSPNAVAAWKLVTYVTTDQVIAEKFDLAADHPPALRSLISRYSDSKDYGVFAKQALIARQWPQTDPDQLKKIFDDMINYANSTNKIEDALRRAESDLGAL